MLEDIIGFIGSEKNILEIAKRTTGEKIIFHLEFSNLPTALTDALKECGCADMLGKTNTFSFDNDKEVSTMKQFFSVNKTINQTCALISGGEERRKDEAEAKEKTV